MRCQVSGGSLRCEDVLKRGKGVDGYDISQDGKGIVFIEEVKKWNENRCVWYLNEKEGTKCIVSPSIVSSGLTISPDSQWITFMRPREIKDNIYTDDLFVIRLKNE